LKKEDITDYALLLRLCSQFIFADNRFRFLIEWDPNALRQPDPYGDLPLYCAAISISKSVIGFRTVFEAGIYSFPKKKGIHLLFVFQCACERFGYDEVMEVTESTLNNTNSDVPFNIADALLPAIVNEKIHLDCAYFLLRREPDVLQKLLLSSSASPSVASTVMGSTNDGNGNDNSDDDNSGSNICYNNSINNINNNIGKNSGSIVDNSVEKSDDGGGLLTTNNDDTNPKKQKRKT
jgi:hypothetical protein